MFAKGMTCLFVIFVISIGFAGESRKVQPTNKQNIIGDIVDMDVNNIFLPMQNDGSCGDDGRGYYPNGTTLGFLFQGGIAATGVINGEIRTAWMAKASLTQEYKPGVWLQDKNDPTAKWYVVNKSDGFGSQAFLDWQDAVTLGADYHNLDGLPGYNPSADRPDLLGDRIAWTPFNDSTTAAQRTPRLGANPLGIEVQQTSWAYSSGASFLRDVVFFRYRIINRGLGNIDSMYFSSWSDPDIGAAEDDLIGCDPARNLGYCYNDSDDDSYGSNPPAFGVQLIQGPIVDTPNPDDRAFRYRGSYFGTDTLHGHINLPLNAVNYYINSDPILGDPTTAVTARRYQIGGLDANGQPIDPTQWGSIIPGGPAVNPAFIYNGDPVSATGWLDTVPGDKRLMVHTGPFYLAIGDTQDVIWAYVVSQADDPISSLDSLRVTADSVRSLFPDFGTTTSIKPDIAAAKSFSLKQNYPNPFNPSTVIEFELASASAVTLDIFNALGERIVRAYRGAALHAGVHNYVWNGVDQNGNRVASGIYYYRLQTKGFAETHKMLLIH